MSNSNRKYFLFGMCSAFLCIFGAWALAYNLGLTREYGSAIPILKPDERHRTHHPEGFSIVRPQGWENEILKGETLSDSHSIYLKSRPDNGYRRTGAMIVVKKLESTDSHHRDFVESNEYKKGTFQGYGGYERTTADPGLSLDRAPSFTYEVATKRKGRWYLIHYTLPSVVDEVPFIVREYFDTFSVE